MLPGNPQRLNPNESNVANDNPSFLAPFGWASESETSGPIGPGPFWGRQAGPATTLWVGDDQIQKRKERWTEQTLGLLPHQRSGVVFLISRNSAVLADEMGLGKTIQALVALRMLAYQGQLRRALLVAPKSLLPNWQRELARWAPELQSQRIYGSPHQRRWLWQYSKASLLLVHYELLVHDGGWLQQFARMGGLFFDVLILDEAQRVKNQKSSAWKIIQSIPRRRLWALTGTPLENSLNDLRGLFLLVRPGLLSPRMTLSEVRSTIGPYLLRRTKDLVAKDLPQKIYRDRLLELSPEQALRYAEAETKARKKLEESGDTSLGHVLVQIIRLKQICNFDPVTGQSAKLEQLKNDLESVLTPGRKALVFSQFVSTLRRLQNQLDPLKPLLFFGGMNQEERERTLHQFRKDPSHQVLLLSYRAGGVGLNLQCASYVFLFDRWWNPAVEDQAISRAHRLGSSSPVIITRYLVAGTIEERIDELLRTKRMLFHRVFSSKSPPDSLGLTWEEWLSLFGGLRKEAA